MADINHVKRETLAPIIMTCRLQALEAVLFVGGLDGEPIGRIEALTAILVRRGVHCDNLRSAALMGEPVVDRQHQVRVTP